MYTILGIVVRAAKIEAAVHKYGSAATLDNVMILSQGDHARMHVASMFCYICRCTCLATAYVLLPSTKSNRDAK